MSGKCSTTQQTPQKQTEETFYEKKIFFHKAFRNIRSLLVKGYAKLTKNPLVNPIFSSRIGPKLQETDSSCRSSSQRWDPNEVVNKKGDLHSLKEKATEDGESSKGSTSVSDQRLEDLKEERTRKCLRGEQEESSFLAAEKFAQKMEKLERMNVNDGEHVTDIDEVVQCYSLLTSPAYLEIVDKFSMDVYRDLNLPQPSRNVSNSMRKPDSATDHSSMRKVGVATIHNSSRNLGSTGVHRSMRRMGCSSGVDTSMRRLGSDNVHSSKKKLNSTTIYSSKRRLDSDNLHGSTRKLGPDSVYGSFRKPGSDSNHGSMRKLDSQSIHGSMRKLESESVHGSMRKLGSDSIHRSMRKLGSESVHVSMRKLGSESIHGSMWKLGSDSIYSSMRCMPSKSYMGLS